MIHPQSYEEWNKWCVHHQFFGAPLLESLSWTTQMHIMKPMKRKKADFPQKIVNPFPLDMVFGSKKKPTPRFDTRREAWCACESEISEISSWSKVTVWGLSHRRPCVRDAELFFGSPKRPPEESARRKCVGDSVIQFVTQLYLQALGWLPFQPLSLGHKKRTIPKKVTLIRRIARWEVFEWVAKNTSWTPVNQREPFTTWQSLQFSTWPFF